MMSLYLGGYLSRPMRYPCPGSIPDDGLLPSRKITIHRNLIYSIRLSGMFACLRPTPASAEAEENVSILVTFAVTSCPTLLDILSIYYPAWVQLPLSRVCGHEMLTFSSSPSGLARVA